MSRPKTRIFDPKDFLAQTGLGRTIMQYPKDKVIFAQGEPSSPCLKSLWAKISNRVFPAPAQPLYGR